MSHPSLSKGKGKGPSNFIDLTIDELSTSNKAVQVQLPSPVSSPPCEARRTISTQAGSHRTTFRPTSRVGPSSSAFPSTPGTKRKAQQARITSFFPAKKSRIETIPIPPTLEEKKATREAERAAKEEDKIARAEARRLAKELEKEERDAKKVEEDIIRAARVEERRLKKNAREAETTTAKASKAAEQRAKKVARDAETERKREIAKWKVDWKDWIRLNRKLDSEFEIPKSEDMWDDHVNVSGTKRYGLSRFELDCLPHCDVKNPMQPNGEDYAPMKMYRVDDMKRLAYRKEAIVNGVQQNDQELLLQEGKRLLEMRMERRDYEIADDI